MRQKNLASVVDKSYLDDIKNPNNLEKDWFLKWMDISQEVSREDVQDILAKILAGEIQKPGLFSYRTLEVVRGLRKKELEIFKKFVALRCDNSVLTLGKSLFMEFGLEKYNITYDDFLLITEAGLISPSNSAEGFAVEKDQKLSFDIDGEIVSKIATKENKLLKMPALLFTLVGKEIAPLVNGENSKKNEYIKDLNNYLGLVL